MTRSSVTFWIKFWLIAGVFLFMCYQVDLHRQHDRAWCEAHNMMYRDSRPTACVDADGVLHQPGITNGAH